MKYLIALIFLSSCSHAGFYQADLTPKEVVMHYRPAAVDTVRSEVIYNYRRFYIFLGKDYVYATTAKGRILPMKFIDRVQVVSKLKGLK